MPQPEVTRHIVDLSGKNVKRVTAPFFSRRFFESQCSPHANEETSSATMNRGVPHAAANYFRRMGMVSIACCKNCTGIPPFRELPAIIVWIPSGQKRTVSDMTHLP